MNQSGRRFVARCGLALGALACAACGPSLEQLRVRGSHDLDCPQDQIRMTPLDEDGDAWGLRGCGKTASYGVTEDTGDGQWVMTKKPELMAPAATP